MGSAPPPLDWDLLRVFLAVMRSDNLRDAASRLGVSHPTIRRKLEALEEQLGRTLFLRQRDGLHATAEAAALIDVAEGVEASVHAFGRRAQAEDPSLSGAIRVTAPEALVSDLLLPDLSAFTERHPEIELLLDVSYEIADLGGREADVALRAMRCGKTPSGDVVGRKVATSYQAIYGDNDKRWIGWWGEERDRAWVKETPFPDLPIRGAMDSPPLQRAACREGMGLSMLPCFYADGHLPRRSKPRPHFDIWVLVHPDLRKNPRLRAFRDEMVAALKRHAPRLRGRASTKRVRR